MVRTILGGRRGARSKGGRNDDDRRAVPVHDHQDGLVLDPVSSHADTGTERAGEAATRVRSKHEEVEGIASGGWRAGGRVRWPQTVERSSQGIEKPEKVKKPVEEQGGQISERGEANGKVSQVEIKIERQKTFPVAREARRPFERAIQISISKCCVPKGDQNGIEIRKLMSELLVSRPVEAREGFLNLR